MYKVIDIKENIGDRVYYDGVMIGEINSISFKKDFAHENDDPSDPILMTFDIVFIRNLPEDIKDKVMYSAYPRIHLTRKELNHPDSLYTSKEPKYV